MPAPMTPKTGARMAFPLLPVQTIDCKVLN